MNIKKLKWILRMLEAVGLCYIILNFLDMSEVIEINFLSEKYSLWLFMLLILFIVLTETEIRTGNFSKNFISRNADDDYIEYNKSRRIPNIRLFDERIKPFYIDGFYASMGLVVMTFFAGLAITVDYIPRWFPILFIGIAFMLKYLLVLRRDYRVMIGYKRKRFMRADGEIVDIKPYGNIAGTHFDSWYSFYPNSKVKLFTITFKNELDESVTAMQMYLTQEEADDIKFHTIGSNIYEIKFIENAKVIYEIVKN